MRSLSLAACAVLLGLTACATTEPCAPDDAACLQAKAERDQRRAESVARQERVLDSTEGVDR